VVIGGYAATAYGPPRYSTDVDIVIPWASVGLIRSWLQEEGFALEKHSIPNPQNYEGQVERYVREPITLDLLAGAVRNREAKVDVPEAWISRSPRRMKVETLSGRTARAIPVARPEAIWALKLQAGRDTDLSDLFAISGQPIDIEEVTKLFTELATDSLRAKLGSVLTALRAPKLYEDSLSRRQLGRPTDPANRRLWGRFVRQVETAVLPIVGTAKGTG
jgi:hypothetical protein